jgi:hypothetical protein
MYKFLYAIKMDVIRAKNLKDAIILALVFFASFFLANTLNQTAVIVYQEKFSSEDKVKDWLIYSGFVILFFVIFIYLLRTFYK